MNLFFMDPIRNKMAEVMRSAARKALNKLDPRSPMAQALCSSDLEAILEDDIRRICEAVSLFEITRALFLAARIPMTKPDELKPIKEELKKIAEKAAERAESKGGKLNIPDCCRELLFEL